MNMQSKKLSRNKLISWLLIATLCLASIFPVHFHMHHDAAATSEAHDGHVIDLHVLVDPADQSHHGDESHSFASTTDGVVKKLGLSFYALAFFAVLLVSLPLLGQILRIKPRDHILQLADRYPHFSPPLRAPPLL